MNAPTLADVFEARRAIAPHLARTPLIPYAGLADLVGADVHVKRNLIEPSGAAPLAAALKLRDRLAGRRVVLIASGGNITLPQLRNVL